MLDPPRRLELAVVEGGVAPLPRRRQRGQRRLARRFAQDRELAVDDAHLGVAGDQPLHVGVRRAAIGAGIVEELDERDVALRVAGDRAGEGRLDLGPVVAQQLADVARLHRRHRLGDDLGVGHDIVVDDALDRRLVGRRRLAAPGEQQHGSESGAPHLCFFLARSFCSTWAMSSARSQSRLPVGRPASATLALIAARLGSPIRS